MMNHSEIFLKNNTQEKKYLINDAYAVAAVRQGYSAKPLYCLQTVCKKVLAYVSRGMIPMDAFIELIEINIRTHMVKNKLIF